MLKRVWVVLVLVLALAALAGCSLFHGAPAGIQFYRIDDDGRSIPIGGMAAGRDLREISVQDGCNIYMIDNTWGIRADVVDENGLVVSAAVVDASGSLDNVAIVGDDVGTTVVVEPVAPGVDTISASGEGVSADLPIRVYDCVPGPPGYSGIIVTADGHSYTNTKTEAAIWQEWRDPAHGGTNAYEWKAVVPAYCAGNPTGALIGANLEQLAEVKTVNTDALAAASTETWLEYNRIYVCQVTGGYLKICWSTSNGLLFQFSPTTSFE